MFIYNEGMVRFATEEWDIQTGTNYDNLFMHLTNYAINKENGNIMISENPQEDKGHKRLLSVVMQVRYRSYSYLETEKRRRRY